jgi:hypothetical protein
MLVDIDYEVIAEARKIRQHGFTYSTVPVFGRVVAALAEAADETAVYALEAQLPVFIDTYGRGPGPIVFDFTKRTVSGPTEFVTRPIPSTNYAHFTDVAGQLDRYRRRHPS